MMSYTYNPFTQGPDDHGFEVRLSYRERLISIIIIIKITALIHEQSCYARHLSKELCDLNHLMSAQFPD